MDFLVHRLRDMLKMLDITGILLEKHYYTKLIIGFLKLLAHIPYEYRFDIIEKYNNL